MKTTLNAIRSNDPCEQDWEKLLKYLGKTKADDEPLLIRTIIESNGVDDALRAVEGCDREIRLFAVWCARKYQHLMTDARSLAALDMAERFANGEATYGELSFASEDAWCVAWSTDASDAAGYCAARAAAFSAAWDANDAASDASDSAIAAERAFNDAASDAIDSQTAELIRVCLCIEKGEDPYPRGEK